MERRSEGLDGQQPQTVHPGNAEDGQHSLLSSGQNENVRPYVGQGQPPCHCAVMTIHSLELVTVGVFHIEGERNNLPQSPLLWQIWRPEFTLVASLVPTASFPLQAAQLHVGLTWCSILILCAVGWSLGGCPLW